jgi:regulator of RNase E activity RraA
MNQPHGSDRSGAADVEEPPTELGSLLQRFGALDSASVSDALDGLGLPSGVGGIGPMWGHPAIVGLAATVELEPVANGLTEGAHIASSAVAQAGPTEVLVVANQGRTDVSCWGGLLSLGASLRGVRGVIADGACRDVGEACDLGFPVFARGRIPVTACGRLQQRATGVPVQVAAREVAPGDVVVADETGVVFVPRDRAIEVLADAEALARREQAIAADLRAGVPLPLAMRDSRLAGTEETDR